MTSDEIKKALECCSIDNNCCYCPYFCGNSTCMDKRDKDALDLINRQQKEIERLSNEIVVHKKLVDERAKVIFEHDAVIRDLHKQLKGVEEIKSETIKEFAELLIDKAEHIATWSDCEFAVTISEIEDTAKELVGE